jgi:hypothetical protein
LISVGILDFVLIVKSLIECPNLFFIHTSVDSG